MDFSELIAAADPSIFTESIKAWVSGLNINSVIMLIMMIFMIVGAIDRIRGNKLGYGEKFEDGFNAIGGLAIAMAGVYAAAPVLSMVLGPIISPIYTAIGADASMFATTILACDMGGYPLAMELASDPSIGNFAGLILGTMMGPHRVYHPCGPGHHQEGRPPLPGRRRPGRYDHHPHRLHRGRPGHEHDPL